MRKLQNKNKIISVTILVILVLTISFIGLSTLGTNAETSAVNATFVPSAIYMAIDGIKGDSQVKGEESSILIESLTYGIGRQTSLSTTSDSGSSGKLSFTEIFVTKSFDSSTSGLVKEMVSGSTLKSVEFRFYGSDDPGKTMPTKYLTITLTDATIASYVHSSAEGVSSESYSFTFSKIVWDYQTGNKTEQVSWDIKTGTGG